MRLAILLALSVLSTSGSSLARAAGGSATGPMATLKQRNGEVDKLLRAKVAAGSEEEMKVKASIKELAGELFDYAELAKRALAEQWEKLKPTQRDEFVATLRGLIERNYTKQLRSNLDYAVSYTSETLLGKEASVTSVVKVKTQGKATDAEIVYKMRLGEHPERGWLVYDVITDEVSLVRNYRTQFAKIIGDKSYDELVKKMKSKLAEPAPN